MEKISNTKIIDNKPLFFPKSFLTPDQLYAVLIKKLLEYHPSSNIEIIEKAYSLAYNAHKNQKRKSGEPYIIHPLCVAIILAELKMDKETIVAGLLHDIVEDTILTNEEIEEQFGENVAIIVDGVTKLTRFSSQKSMVDLEAENLRKLFLSMAKDIRVILVKLADRLHNMRTLQFQSQKKQMEISRETLEIYSPLALRLGISKIQVELDDWAFRYLHRDIYDDITMQLALTKVQRADFINKIINELSKLNTKAEVESHQKHIYSIYKKTLSRNKRIEELYDIYAIYVIVDNVEDCYSVLGEIHNLYHPLPNRFKDYIALPKQNMYQSLHTTVFSKEGGLFEIQIKTKQMYQISQYGITYHWKYKETEKGNDIVNDAIKAKWLQSILDWQRDERDNVEFLSFLKMELESFANTIYCFTPLGDIKILPAGATVADFAYFVHTDLGNKFRYAIVNGQQRDYDYTLNNGDRVRIVISGKNERGGGPTVKWLEKVKTPTAKAKIKQFLKIQNKDKEKNAAENIISNLKRILGNNQLNEESLKLVYNSLGYSNWGQLEGAILCGKIKAEAVYSGIINEILHKQEVRHTRIKLSRCCNPLPGDEIVGYCSSHRGIIIHKITCENMQSLIKNDDPRIISISWDDIQRKRYITQIIVETDENLETSKKILTILDKNKIKL